jgi:hypothetical protein
MTHKAISVAALEHNKLLQATWQAAHAEILMEYFVWVDESGVDDCTTQWLTSWSLMGTACIQRAAFIRGVRYSVLSALSLDGIIALDIFEGSVNKSCFFQFVREELVSLTSI